MIVFFHQFLFFLSFSCIVSLHCCCYPFLISSFHCIVPFLSVVLCYYFTPLEFLTSALADGFHWSVNENKSPQVSRTLHSILADLNNAGVWIVCIQPLISKSSCPFYQTYQEHQRQLVNCDFHFLGFFNSLARSRYLSFFSLFFQFPSAVRRDSKVHNSASSLFFSWL